MIVVSGPVIHMNIIWNFRYNYRCALARSRRKLIVNNKNTSKKLIQQSTLCLWLIYCLLYCSYLVFK